MNTRFFLSFLFLLCALYTNAQNLVGPVGYGKQEQRFSANLFFRPPVLEDTTCDLVANTANGDCFGALVILRSDGKLYQRDSTGFRRVGGLNGVVLDSARRSNDTLYFRRTDGSEVGVRMQGILINGVNGLQDSLSNKPTFAQGDGRYFMPSGSYADPSAFTSWNWSKITSRPTTLAGYGITDAVPISRTILPSGNGLTGGGDLSANRTFSLDFNYLDDRYTSGYKQKDAARVATTANITLSGAQTIDGVSAIAGDRVLVKNQTAAEQNGIYVVAAGVWARSSDFDVAGPGEIEQGAALFVQEGTMQAKTGWSLSTAPPITVGTTPLTFIQYAGANNYTAGTGLSLTGNQFSAQTTTALWNALQLRGTGISSTAPTNGQLLRYDGSNWSPFTPNYLTANQTITLTGDVTGSGTTSISGTIANGAVTYAKMQNVTASRLLGRYTASNGVAQEISIGTGLTLNTTTGVLSNTGVISTPTLDAVLAVGNDAINNDIDFVGDNRGMGWWSGASRRFLFRKEAEPTANFGFYKYDDAGVPALTATITRATSVWNFTAIPTIAGTAVWYNSNHPAGSAFTPTLSGANVLSTMTVNSAGHITALTTRALTAGDIGAAPATGSGNYIQNQFTSTQSGSNLWVSGVARANNRFDVAKDGSNTYTPASSPHILLQNNAGSRGAAFQLNGDTNPGLATWIHNGTTWIKRQEYFADGKAQFYGQTLIPNLSGVVGTGTGTSNISYFPFYESNGTTRQGYIGKGSGSVNSLYVVSDIGNVEIIGDQDAEADINLNATGKVGLTNSTKNHIVFNNVGVGAPTFSTRSVGTKIVAYPLLSATQVDYAAGIETAHQWYSVPQNNTTYGFKWYGGTTEVARLSGTGQHSVNTSYTAPLITSPTATSLTVSSATGESILFNPAGTNRGTWDADGRLGIGGTPSPARASLLEVNGNVWSTDAYILGTTSSPTAELGLSGGGTNGSAFVRTMGTGNLDLQTGASETRMQINGTTGNVGIGVISPTYKLQVEGSVSFASGNVTINTLGQMTAQTISAAGSISSLTDITAVGAVNAGTSLNATGSQYVKARIITASTTALANDHAIICNTASGSITLTLPTSVGIDGFMYRIKKSSTANTLTIDPSGSEQIVGPAGAVATLSYTTVSEGVTIIAQGGAWYVF